jgi:hypothetical protein
VKKLLQFSTLIFALVLASATKPAHAEESYKIFIDLNNSDNEIRAAIEGAKPEKIIVIPHRSAAQQEILHELYETEKLLDSSPGANLVALQKKKTALMATVKTFFGSLPIPSEKISQELSDTLAKVQPITSLIVSGHHLDGLFKGEFGTITDPGMGAALVNNADKTQAIRSVFGMGCYTATAGSVQEFRELLPNLVEVGGFDPTGLLRFDSQDAAYLKSSLTTENQLLKAFDEKKNQEELDAIIHSATLNYKNAAICVCHICTSNVLGDVDIDEVMNSCSLEALSSISARVQAYWTMMKPETAENRAYCNTSSSPLRTLYSDVKNHEQCATADITLGSSFAPYTQTAPGLIRMVHFQDVLNNFVRYNAKNLNQLQALSKIDHFRMINLKVPMTCIGANSRSPKLDRGDILRWINSLPNLPEILTLKNRMTTQLGHLHCVPADWVNPPDLDQPAAPPEPCCLPEDKAQPACGGN